MWVFPWQASISAFSSCLEALLFPLLRRFCSFSFQVLFQKNYFICSCSFVVSMGGCVFRVFSTAVLNPHFSECFILGIFLVILFCVTIICGFSLPLYLLTDCCLYIWKLLLYMLIVYITTLLTFTFVNIFVFVIYFKTRILLPAGFLDYMWLQLSTWALAYVSVTFVACVYADNMARYRVHEINFHF